MLAAGLRLLGLAVNNLVVVSASAVPLLYGLPIGAIVVCIVLIERNRRRLGSNPLLDFIGNKTGDLMDAVRRLGAPLVGLRNAGGRP